MTMRPVRARRHEDSHLALLDPADLPTAEPFLVTVQIPERGTSPGVVRPLCGRFPELGQLTEDDFAAAKKALVDGANRQLAMIEQAEQ